MRSFLLLSLLSTTILKSQAQVGVGTSSVDASARMQVDANAATNQKGFLPPRVSLSSTNSNSPFSITPASGLLVYNTATSGSGSTIVTPGYYYYNGTSWVRLIGPSDNATNVTGTVAVANGGTGTTTSTGTGSVVLSNSPTLVTPTLGTASATYINSMTIGRGPGNQSKNTVLGESVFASNSSGQGNTVMGYQTSFYNSSGWENTSIGAEALHKNQSGNNSVAIGFRALHNSLANSNDAMGHYALYGNLQGTENIALGQRALVENTTGNQNTVVGLYALPKNSTGSENIAIGFYAGQNIADGTNHLTKIDRSIIIGVNAKANAINETNQIVIGYNAIGAGSNTIRLGNTSITSANVQVAWTTTSDKRWKSNIQDIGLGLDFIKKIRPVSYYRNNDEKKRTEYGFIAQELEETLNKMGATNPGIISKDGAGMYSLRYNDLLAPMVKAIQDQQTMIEEQNKKIEELRNMIEKLAVKK